MDLFLLCMKIFLGRERFSLFLNSFHEGNILLLSDNHLVLDAPLFLDAIMPKYF